MNDSHRKNMDIVRELRLRRWAREHFVEAEERKAEWHPIVLDEMRLKDDEMIILSRSRPPVSSFVPLVPTAIQRVHPRHSDSKEPNLEKVDSPTQSVKTTH
jgi:hypothetical protein